MNIYQQIGCKKINDMDCFLYKHIKSGANIFFLQNNDPNKVFLTAFKTPPEDDCGTPHIIEHCILTGSKKYRVKDMFNELSKGSLHTYLNAMTFKDKTVYAVAGTNHVDFRNLTDVYLDAVFNPLIENRPGLFMQEGWHYQAGISERDCINGVVYNEMKGAYAVPEKQLADLIDKNMFKGTCYQFSSGGRPDSIIKLSYEQLIDYYKKYYHPSNSYIYLYGNIHKDAYLDFLNRDYLSQFDYKDIQIAITPQQPFVQPQKRFGQYFVSPREYTVADGQAAFLQKDDGGKNYFAISFLIGRSWDAENVMALEILCRILMATSASPLKKAILEANIAKDCYISLYASQLQPIVTITLRDCRENPEMENVIMDALAALAKGIDENIVKSALHYYEFYHKEEDFGIRPRGLVLGLQALRSWLYGKSPFVHLDFHSILGNIKNKVSDRYFESVIERCFIKNNNRLATFLSSTEDATPMPDILQNTILPLDELKKYQNAPSEDIDAIPSLPLKEIDKDPVKIPFAVQGQQNLYTFINTKEIIYVNLLFDLNCLHRELIPFAGLLPYLIGGIDTKLYSYESLHKEIHMHTGGISCMSHVYYSGEKFIPKLILKGKSFTHNHQKLFFLLNEIGTSTIFENEKFIFDQLMAIKAKMETNFIANGHLTAIARGLSYSSAGHRYNQLLSGIDFYYFVCSLIKNYDFHYIKENLENAYQFIFNKENMMQAAAGHEQNYDLIQNGFQQISFDTLQKQNKPISFDFAAKNEGFKINAGIQYNVLTGRLSDSAHLYGYLQLLKTIINGDFLWENIRVKGGAYGCGIQFLRNGFFYIYSYRDPHLRKTLDVYNEIPEHIKNFNKNTKIFSRYIIGTMNALDQPLSYARQNETSISRFIANIRWEQLRKERECILSGRSSHINELYQRIDDGFKQTRYCVLGNGGAIELDKDLFSDIFYLLKS